MHSPQSPTRRFVRSFGRWLNRTVADQLGVRVARPRLQVEALEDRWVPAPINWINPTGGDWNDPNNWDLLRVPNAGDDATISFNNILVTHSTAATDAVNSVVSNASFSLTNGSLAINATGDFNNSFELNKATLTGPGDVTLNGPTTISGGIMDGGGTTDFLGTTTLNGVPAISNRTLNNFGTVNQTDTLTTSNVVLNNMVGDTWNITLGNNLFTGGTSTTFNNSGTVNVAGAGLNSFFVILNNNGIFNLTGGQLRVFDGGTHNGNFNIGMGATLEFGGGTHTFTTSSNLTGPGGLTFSTTSGGATIAGGFSVGGQIGMFFSQQGINFTNTVNGSGTATFNSLNFDTGNLIGAATITVNGPARWFGGTMGGTGVTNLLGSSTVSPGSSNYRLDGRTLNNAGTVFADGTLNLLNGAVVNNQSAGFWNLVGPTNGALAFNGGTFNNVGTLVKNSAGRTNTNTQLNNNGVVSVQTGQLDLSGTGSSTGTYTVAAGALLQVAGTQTFNTGSAVTGAGTFTLNGTLTIQGNSTIATPFQFPTGTVTGVGNLAINGPLTWSGGTISSSGVTSIGGPATLTGSLAFSSGQLTNGNVITTSAALALSNGAVLVNLPAATWELLDGSAITGSGSFLTAGTVSKPTGSATAAILVPVRIDGGSVNAQSGILDFATVTNEAGTLTIAGNATAALSTYTQNGGVLAGGGTVVGNVIVNGGSVSPGLSPGALTINGNYTQGSGGSLNIEVTGATPGSQFDTLTVTGAANLAGTLNIQRAAGFVPSAGASLRFLNAGSVSGTFTTVNGAAITGSQSFTVTYGSNFAALDVAAAIAPAIVSVTSTTPNGTYGVGAAINGTVTFNKAVTLAGGNLTIRLNSGGTVTIAPFTNQTSATGTYTVAAGESANPLDTISPLVLASGATLRDAVGADVSLAIPSSGTLASSSTIVINTTPPPPQRPETRFAVITGNPNTSAQFFLDNNGDGVFGSGDANFTFGLIDDIFLAGDWNGLGFESVGVMRTPPGGVAQFVLDSNGNDVYDPADRTFTYGLASDVPVIGDWNGDGKTKVGVVRGAPSGAAVFSLDTNGNGTFDGGDQTLTFGFATDKFGAGDWAGLGRDALVVERAGPTGLAVFTFDFNGNGVFDNGDRIATFGLDSDVFVVGDWNGDGRTKIGVMRSGPNGEAVFSLDTNGNGTFDVGSDQVFSLGRFADNFLTGRWRSLSSSTTASSSPSSSSGLGGGLGGRLTAADGEGAGAAAVSDAAFRASVTTAMDQWARAGLDSHNLSRLGSLTYRVADLSGAGLGIHDGNTITLDDDAASHGWSSEGGDMDLVTALAHEMGHALGLEHSAAPSDLMFDTLALDGSRAPTLAHVDALFAQSGASVAEAHFN